MKLTPPIPDKRSSGSRFAGKSPTRRLLSAQHKKSLRQPSAYGVNAEGRRRPELLVGCENQREMVWVFTPASTLLLERP